MSEKKEQTQTQSQVQNPWAPQVPFLNQAFSGASNALNQAQSTPTPDQFVAQFTPQQLGLFNQMVGYGSNPAVANNTANTGGILSNAGTAATTGALSGLAGYNPASTSSILSDANLAMQDPSVEGSIDAALRDARRSVNEQQLPAVDRNASITGNTNSSRTGVQQGIIQRGLADTTADVSSAVRNNIINNAFNRAQQTDTSRLGALSALLSGGNTAASTGVDANTASIAQQGGLFDIANAGAAGGQAANQAAIDNALAKYQFGVSAPFDALNNFYNIIGANNWGGTSSGTGTTTQTTTPSTFSTLGSILGAAGFGLGKNGLNLFGR